MQPQAELLSGMPLFLGGCLGGFAAALATLAIPWLVDIWLDQSKVSGTKFISGGLLLIAHAFCGGVVAIVVGDTTNLGQAIVHGVLWPTTLKTVGETGREIAGRRG